MDRVLINPLSRNGKNKKFVKKVVRFLKKNGSEVKTYNILEIGEVKDFALGCDEDDRIIIVGGDGTVNRLANRIYDFEFKQKLYMYQAGTGNDFARSLKVNDKLILLNKHIKKLPTVSYKGESRFFLNGAGVGLDGYVGYLVNNSKFKKNKLNYFRHTVEAFASFKPMGATILRDGVKTYEKKVWFISVMNSPYFGGGMKIAPNADRSKDDLDVVIVKNIPKLILIFIFPLIYLGWHRIFRSYVSIEKGKNVAITFDKPTYLQIDGEVEYPIDFINVKSV